MVKVEGVRETVYQTETLKIRSEHPLRCSNYLRRKGNPEYITQKPTHT